MKTVFDPMELNHLNASNRLVRSATWEGIAAPDGSVSDEAFDLYDELAAGGVGTIITGFTSVADDDTYFGGMMRLSNDALIPQYKKLVDLIHSHGVPVITQLALGGFYRKNAFGRSTMVEPDDMTTEEVRLVIDRFIAAAGRAKEAGFDGVQIHAAHFFFLSRFVSPAFNHRTDEYGGNTENRSRILLEILEGIRSVAPDLHVTIKINCSDFTAGGLEEPESMVICKALAKAGIDSIEVSGNGTSVPGIRPGVNEAYFGNFAAQLADEVDTPVILVGGMRSLDIMNAVLEQTNIAMLSLSRPLLREPDLPQRMKDGSATVSKCISCNRCYSSPSHKCVFRGRD